MINSEQKRMESPRHLILQLIDNRSFLYALLAICFETYGFISNQKDLELSHLLEKCQINALDFWRLISNFAKIDKFMPFAIKEHLFHIERTVLLYNAWEDGQILPVMIETFFSDKKGNSNNNNNIQPAKHNNLYQETLCKRIFYHCALRVFEICKALELKEEVSEKVWNVLKYIFENEAQIF